jgi:hypothetical protein
MKPVNKFALIFWIVAAIFLLADVPMMLAIKELARETSVSQGPKIGNFVFLLNFWNQTRAALLGAGQLAGIGIIIELIDKIRWNSLPLEAREQKISRRSVWWYLRHWPHSS